MKMLHIQLRTPLLRKAIVKSLESPLGDVVGREVKLRLLGQTVSVDRAALSRLWPGSTAEITWTVDASEAALRAAHEQLAALIRQGSSALIPVSRAGGGRTEKSGKITVSGVLHPPAGLDDEATVHSHTLTVPVSQLVERDGQWYAPRWLLMRTVHERIFEGKRWPQCIDGGVWLGAEDVWHELWEPMLADVDRLLAEDEAARERRTQEAAARQAESAERARRYAEQQEARAKAQHEREQSRQTNLNRLETIGPTRVEWDEWEVGKNAYGSKTRTKVVMEAESCTLKLSGERVYILLPDGSEIIKARHNVRWQQG